MILSMLIFGYVVMFVFLIIGYIIDKLEKVNILPIFLFFAGILTIFLTISVFSEGIEYRVGHNDTLSSSNTTLIVRYTYENLDTTNSTHYNLIFGIFSTILSLAFLLGCFALGKSRSKEETETY